MMMMMNVMVACESTQEPPCAGCDRTGAANDTSLDPEPCGSASLENDTALSSRSYDPDWAGSLRYLQLESGLAFDYSREQFMRLRL